MSIPVPPSSANRNHLSVGKGTSILVIGTGLLFLFGFLSRVLIARNFSVTDWGTFSIALALSGFLSILALLGLDQALARALAFERSGHIRRAFARHGLTVATLSGIACSCAVYLASAPLAAAFHISGSAWVLQLFSITIGMSVVATILAAIFQGLEDVFPNAFFNEALNPGLFVAAIVVVVILHAGFYGVVVGYVAAEVIALAALFAYTIRRWPSWKAAQESRSPDPVPVAPLWRLSGSLWGVTTLAYVTAFVDTLILGLYDPPADVGLYTAIMTLGRVLLISNGTLTYIYLPVASRLGRENDLAAIRSTYLTGTRWLVLLTVPGFLLLLLLPGVCLSTVFGSGYASSTLPLQVLVVPAFLAVLVGPSNAALAGLGKFRGLLMNTAVAATTNLVLSFTLIPLYGILGAALAWGVARALYPSFGLGMLYRSFRVNPFGGSLVRPLVVTFVLLVPLDLWASTWHVGAWILIPLYVVGLGVAFAGVLATRSGVAGDLAILSLTESALHHSLPALRRWIQRSIADPGPALRGDTTPCLVAAPASVTGPSPGGEST